MSYTSQSLVAGLEPATHEGPVISTTGQGWRQRAAHRVPQDFRAGEQAVAETVLAQKSNQHQVLYPLSYRRLLSERDSNPRPPLFQRSICHLHHRPKSHDLYCKQHLSGNNRLRHLDSRNHHHRKPKQTPGNTREKCGLGASALRNLVHRDYVPAPHSKYVRQDSHPARPSFVEEVTLLFHHRR